VPTDVVSSLQLDGTAKQVVVEVATVNINSRTACVATGGSAIVTVGNALKMYDLTTGQLEQTLALNGGNIVSLAHDGFTLYTLDQTNKFTAIDTTNDIMTAEGSLVTLDGPLFDGTGGSIFVGNGIAYVSASSFVDGGYDTINVSNPNSLHLISGSSATSTNASPNPYVVANGSGLIVMAVAGGRGVNPLVMVLKASDGSFVTSSPLNSAPSSMVIAGGIGYIADAGSGLQIVN